MAITLTKKKPKYKKLQKKYKKLDREFIDSGSMEKAREVYDVKTPFPKLAKKKITKKTAAIIPVHLFGNNGNLNELIEISKQYNIKILKY